MTMEDAKITVLSVFGFLVVIVALGLGARAWGIFDKKTFGVLDENADTEVYRHSEAYREGLQRDFDELVRQYAAAKTQDEKDALLATLRHRAEGAPPEYVPANVRALIGGGL